MPAALAVAKGPTPAMMLTVEGKGGSKGSKELSVLATLSKELGKLFVFVVKALLRSLQLVTS